MEKKTELIQFGICSESKRVLTFFANICLFGIVLHFESTYVAWCDQDNYSVKMHYNRKIYARVGPNLIKRLGAYLSS